MSAENNKAFIGRFTEEVINGKNLAVIDELLASDFVEHEELPTGAAGGREGVKQFLSVLFNAFPDLQATVEDIVAEGDRVASRGTWRGTHRGEFMGIPPTGKTATFAVIDLVRVRDGKVTDHWGVTDTMGLMQQLGVIPPMG